MVYKYIGLRLKIICVTVVTRDVVTRDVEHL